MTRPFLDVERSLSGRSWRERLGDRGQAHALAMAQQHGTPDLLARVLAGRGVTADTCQAFLAPSLRDSMPDPETVQDMTVAVARLAAAIACGEQVAIFGDYDVDGATSAALLAGFLRAAGLDPSIHIPDRILEGYGPNIRAIEAFAAHGITLLVTVDCGTASHEALAAARALGLDAIVIDHHRAPERLPEAVAVVNANRADDLSGLGHLCAAGMVYMVLVALNRRLRQQGFWTGRTAPDLLAGLDLVALGTVADVVPLTGLNRAFVTKGLTVIQMRGRPGLRALFDIAGADGPPSAYHLGYLIGPRINAGGRIGDAGLGVRLLLANDPIEARVMAEQLDRHNRERRVIEAAALEEAQAAALAGVEAETNDAAVLVSAGVGWHPGVVGLVAARLKERHGRPAFALAISGDHAVGSGRSIPGVDLGKVVGEALAAGLLLKGGGHAMAAGITVESRRIAELRAFLAERIGPASAAARAEDAVMIDATISARGFNPETAALLDTAGPYGSAHPEVVVAVPGHRLQAVYDVGTEHLRLQAVAPDGTGLSAIAFRAAATPLGEGLRRALGRPVHLAGSLTASRRHGGGRVELRVLDAAEPSGPV